ncbi:MAG: Ldh family oxidoreductase [Sphingobacteriaceae bacterium]|nr:Ldh family oxidoreductase [Sphingobacteriaceae bacterium]
MKNWAARLFVQSGLSEKHANTIAAALTETSLFGIDSHGVARITHYLGRLENGTIEKNPKLLYTKTAAATGQLDGGDGHGIVIMTEATDKAIQLAQENGTGVVGVHNSSHCGAIGLYTRQIARAGMVGFAFTHADALVVPHGGNKPFFGTNPISISFPTENNEEPVCIDMATSIVPWNYMMNAKREKSKVPFGLGVDKNGKDSDDSANIVAVKPMAEHKGYALAFLIDLLCGPLNGMNFGPNMTSMYQDLDKKRKLGSLVFAIDPARFGGRDNFRAAATAMINQVKTHGEEVLFPGQPEYLNKAVRMKSGIPITQSILDDFNAWAKKLNVDPIA